MERSQCAAFKVKIKGFFSNATKEINDRKINVVLFILAKSHLFSERDNNTHCSREDQVKTYCVMQIIKRFCITQDLFRTDIISFF